MEQPLYERFLNPPNEFRGKPLWSWNGKLNEKQLIKQIHKFKVMGFGGFYMHSRVGLNIEYLGEEWMKLVRKCAEEAKRIGMEAWLYDEDRWPSGTAGGLVTINPSFRLKFLRADSVESDLFQWNDSIIAAFSCQLDGINVRNCLQLERNEPNSVPHNGTILFFTVTEMASSSFYNGFTYLDTLNREATDRFLELTHDSYSEACGDLFGSMLQGIFTDEPHRGSILDGFGITNPDKERHLPWTYDLFDRFQSAFGYDLATRLPELFYRLDCEVVSQVKWHYIELLQRMFLENFAQPVQEWCRQHGLRLTGHILHEDSLTAQTAMSGSVMRYYEHMDEPGIDVLTENNQSYWVAKQLSSVARQLGKKRLFSELYGCTGWQMSFQGHKAVGDWQALFGINARSHHLAWYTMEGEAKRDFPGSIGPQSSWWKEYEKIESYYARIGMIMSQGRAVCDIMVLNPVESVWCQVYCGWSSSLVPLSPEVIRIEQQYRQMFQWLAGAQLDFDYGDEHILSQYGSITKDESDFPVLKVGESSYRIVVIAGMVTIRSSTLRLLEAFLQAGGKVVVSGPPPSYVDALKSQVAADLMEQGTQVGWNENSIIKDCESCMSVYAKANLSSGEPAHDVYAQIRKSDDGYIVLFINMNREKWLRHVCLYLSIHGAVEQWNALTGERCRVQASSTGDGLELIADFPPSGERLYFIQQHTDTSVSPQLIYEETLEGQWDGPFTYQLDEPNVCVLDRAAYRIDDGEWQEEIEIVKADRAIRNVFKVEWRNNKMIQPWYAMTRGLWPSEALGRISLEFRFHVEQITEASDETDGMWYLAMEHPENFSIFVNEERLSGNPVQRDWVDHCFKLLPLPISMLRIGDNLIVLETEFHERIDLEAVYILGNFGVKLEGTNKKLTRLPEYIQIGDLANQGLPFYGGMISFQIDTSERHGVIGNIAEVCTHILRLPAIHGACAKVVLGSGEEHFMPWTPYEADISEAMCSEDCFEIQLFLTRRNTFGPLHMVPVRSNAYSPDHFHTEGEHYAQDYVLWPSGLAEPPQHIIRRFIPEETNSRRMVIDE